MKLKPQGKYNFLLIHDDGTTKSYRISRTTIRFLLVLAVILPLFGGGGGWLGWKAWQREKIWDEEERVLQNEMISLRMQLNRLSHIEKLIQEHESGMKSDAAAKTERTGSPSGQVPPAVASSPSEDPAAASDTAASAPQTVDPGQGSPVSPAGQTDEEYPEFPLVSSDTVRLDNASVILVDGRRLRVRLDLHNESNHQIAGKVLLFVLSPEGQRVELAHNDPTFRISRLKKFAASSVVPDSVEQLTNASLMVEVVDSSSALLCRQIYPIAD